ncbi:MAG: fused protease/ribonucleoside-triphosphate reductase [Actinobacteria bacterium]|nr:fused protease/ribonucleoside-triphosphate reductase [Actinomycetota bacterium]
MFKLDDNFVNFYRNLKPDWGFPSGPNSVGELTYARTYSRIMADGNNETWPDTVRRVVEGTYEIQRRHAVENDRDWSDEKALESAQEMFDRIYNFKFTPSGRGLWMQGTDYVLGRKNSAPLFNCAMVSTEELKEGSAYPFTFLMDMSMLGVGVGFDTLGAGAPVYLNSGEEFTFVIPDSREGWVESVKLLSEAYLQHAPMPKMDYSEIRPLGTPIKGFGGTASGPAPLKKLHDRIHMVFQRAQPAGELSSRDIVDIQNMIGACVVAGNVRRSAEIALGSVGDAEFLNLKNYEENPERGEWGWASNNTIVVRDGDEVDYAALAERISDNGEPGLFYLDVARKYGRMGDEPDYGDMKVVGTNPCAEIPLESSEFCNLVEVYPTRCTDIVDFLRTLKFAYLYAKSVTLIETHDERVNEVLRRNRRIGTSVSGAVQFVHRNSYDIFEQWLRAGYGYIDNLDAKYSDWLGVPKSIRKTTVKPSGSVSLLAGVTPGVHYPTADYYIRRIRLQEGHPLVDRLIEGGYKVERDVYSDNTLVVEMPVKGEGLPTEYDVSVFDKADMATFMAKHWADNSVSVTVTFQPHEAEVLETVMRNNEGKWKSVSFMPIAKQAYAQMPYEEITPAQYEDMIRDLRPMELIAVGTDGEMEEGCTTDICEVKYIGGKLELIYDEDLADALAT